MIKIEFIKDRFLCLCKYFNDLYKAKTKEDYMRETKRSTWKLKK